MPKYTQIVRIIPRNICAATKCEQLCITITMRLKTSNSFWIAVGAALIALVLLVRWNSGQVQAQTQAPASLAAAQPQPEIKSAPPTPIAEKKAELGDDETWQPEWDGIVEKALPRELLSSQVARAVKPLCPRFNSMREVDKRAYWAYFFQALSGAEAGLKPTADVRHTEPDVAVKDEVTHRIARQQGLLQLAYMDSERYGCDFDWEKDKELAEHDPSKTILQPENNLLCGVKILKNQLIDQHKPLLSSTSYWSTLQPGTISVKVFLKQMANVPAACGRRPVRGEQKPGPAREESTASVPSQTIAAAH